MNKKQVMKIELSSAVKDEKQTMYGIGIDDKRVLLENGQIGDIETGKAHTLRGLYGGGLEIQSHSYDPNISMSATRNVPPEIRASLEKGLTTFLEAEKLGKECKKLFVQDWHIPKKNALNAIKEILDGKLEGVTKDMPAEIRQHRGILSEAEFVQVFMDNLSPEVTKELNMLASYKTGYYIEPCPFEASFAYKLEAHGEKGSIVLERSVTIDKYHRKEDEMCFEEYDGTMMLRRDAEYTTQYKQLMREFSQELPVKSVPFKEWITFGDKDSLIYQGVYDIPLTKELTRDYAEKLAKDFCDPKKTLVKEKPKKGNER